MTPAASTVLIVPRSVRIGAEVTADDGTVCSRRMTPSARILARVLLAASSAACSSSSDTGTVAKTAGATGGNGQSSSVGGSDAAGGAAAPGTGGTSNAGAGGANAGAGGTSAGAGGTSAGGAAGVGGSGGGPTPGCQPGAACVVDSWCAYPDGPPGSGGGSGNFGSHVYCHCDPTGVEQCGPTGPPFVMPPFLVCYANTDAAACIADMLAAQMKLASVFNGAGCGFGVMGGPTVEPASDGTPACCYQVTLFGCTGRPLEIAGRARVASLARGRALRAAVDRIEPRLVVGARLSGVIPRFLRGRSRDRTYDFDRVKVALYR